MGMLKEMFGEENGEFEKKPPVLLAKGRYKSTAGLILSGYKTFQLKYVMKNLIAKMLLVLLALASSIMMLMTSEDVVMPAALIMICVVIGIYFISEPFRNRRKLKSGLENIEGTEYEVEITDQTVKISTIASPDDEEKPAEAAEENNTGENPEDEASGEEKNKEDDGPPATLIHLDSHIVDFMDKEDMFIVCVKKSYVFIIPKSAFSEEDVQRTREKLSAILGIRFKIVD